MGHGPALAGSNRVIMIEVFCSVQSRPMAEEMIRIEDLQSIQSISSAFCCSSSLPPPLLLLRFSTISGSDQRPRKEIT